jgi:transposase-like protein
MKQKFAPDGKIDLSSLTVEQMEEVLAGYMASKATSMDDFFGKNGLLASMFGKSIETMLQAEMNSHLGRDKYEKIQPDIKDSNYRNGTSSKTLNTSVGPEEIAVPRDRNGMFEPKILGKYEKSTTEFEDKIIAMYAKGMTVRDIAKTLEEMYGVSVSPEFISMVTDKVNQLVTDWQTRPLENVYPFVFFDAIHLKIRMDSKVETRAVYTCLGIDLEGQKDILGIWVSPAKENANFWLSVISEIQKRGVSDILIASIDGLKGLRDAILAVFPATITQRCIVHLIRNSLKYVSWKDRKEFMSDLKPIYNAINEEDGLNKLVALKAKWGNKYSLAVKVWEANWEELNPFFEFSQTIRKIMYTTNSVESYHRVLRKYTKTKSVFPSELSALKVLFMATEGIVKKWDKVIPNWNIVLSQLSIKFEGRIN